MYYDAAQKAWIDSDTQAVIFREDGGDITPADAGQQSSDGRDIIPTTIAPVVVCEDGKIELGGVPLGIDSRGSKYQVLEMIPLDESQKHSNASSGGDISPPAAALLSPGTIARPSFNSMGISKAPSASTIPAAGQVSNLERELIAMHSSGNAEYLRLEEGTHEAIEIGDDGEAKTHHMWDDWTVARALQAMEFEISADQLQRDARDEDFNNKELRSSSCKRQFLTVSFAICIAQVQNTFGVFLIHSYFQIFSALFCMYIFCFLLL